MSVIEDESIVAWVVNNETDGYYDLYIGSDELIYAQNLGAFFANMTGVDSINFSNLDTSKAKNMSFMFYETGYSSTVFTLDLGDKFDTSNVADMSFMFCDAATAEGAQITVNYTSETSTLVNDIINTKSDTSNVVKGSEVTLLA